MKKLICNVLAAVYVGAGIAASSTYAGQGGVPQGSITLQDFNVALCHHNDTQWSLDKTTAGLDSSNNITWIVTAAKTNTTPSEFIVYGYLTVSNGGSGTVSIGNIIVNLEKRANNNWVSAAADISTAKSGDISGTLGAYANIVAAGSQEDPAQNGIYGAGNYAVGVNLPACSASTSVGTFTTTAGSVKLQFFNADDNSMWAITDTNLNTVPPGGTRYLLYKAWFDPNKPGMPGSGDQVRIETLATFGNAGARGGSGASVPNVDIDMDGGINGSPSCTPFAAGPEDNVRTVPTRFSTTMPGLLACNSTVHLHDDGAYTESAGDSGCVSAASNNTLIDENITDTTTKYPYVMGVTNSCSHAVNFCNVATLQGVNCDWPNSLDCNLSLNIVTLTGSKTVTEPCCVGLNLATVPSCVALPGHTFSLGDYCTFTQNDWGSKPVENVVGALLWNNFATVYPGGSVTVGGGFTMTFVTVSTTVNGHVGKNFHFLIPAGAIITTNYTTGQNPTIKDYDYTLITTVPAMSAIDLYLPADKTPDQLNVSLINPDKSHSGVFGGQVLALQLNVDFSANPAVDGRNVGAVMYCADDLPSVQGLTISQILAKANAVLGGATTASQGLYQQDGITPMTVSQLNDLIDNLNQAFDHCAPSDWAQSHLCNP